MSNERGQSQVDYTTLLKYLDDASKPMLAKLERIETRLIDMATKVDLQTLRAEVFDKIDKQTSNMVPRDVYETRHATLVDRDSRIEDSLRQHMTTTDQKYRDLRHSIDNARQEATLRSTVEAEKFEEKLKTATDKELNGKDRQWVRSAQVSGWIAVAFSVVSVLFGLLVNFLQHYKP